MTARLSNSKDSSSTSHLALPSRLTTRSLKLETFRRIRTILKLWTTRLMTNKRISTNYWNNRRKTMKSRKQGIRKQRPRRSRKLNSKWPKRNTRKRKKTRRSRTMKKSIQSIWLRNLKNIRVKSHPRSLSRQRSRVKNMLRRRTRSTKAKKSLMKMKTTIRMSDIHNKSYLRIIKILS